MKKKKHPIKQMSKEMLGMAGGGMIAGAGTMALGKMGAPAVAVGGLTAGASMMPAIGSIVGAKAVIGITSKIKIPKMKGRKKK